jgi:hypothetical protein
LNQKCNATESVAKEPESRQTEKARRHVESSLTAKKSKMKT